MSRASYTITYEPASVLGEFGYEYVITCRGRFVSQGWSRGGQRHAERQVRDELERMEGRAA
jgi:hypothetical protein